MSGFIDSRSPRARLLDRMLERGASAEEIIEALAAEQRRIEELGVITMRSTANNETSLTIPNAIANFALSSGEHMSRAARALNKPTRAQKTMARKRAKRGR